MKCMCSLVVVDTAREQSCSYCTIAPSSVHLNYVSVDLHADVVVVVVDAFAFVNL